MSFPRLHWHIMVMCEHVGQWLWCVLLCAACLHFSLFNLDGQVCESQLQSLLIGASPLNMSACYNACQVAIYNLTAPWVSGWWGNAATLSLLVGCRQSVSVTEGGTVKKKEEVSENVLTGGEDRDSFALLNLSITTEWPAAPATVQSEIDHTRRPVISHSFDVSVTTEMD